MTDNEIIKALENNKVIEALEGCVSDNPPCHICKYDGDTTTVDECMGELMKDALDLILQLKDKVAMWQSVAEMNAGDAKLFLNELNTARDDAIKEFADRLKEKGKSQFSCCEGWVDFEDIDNLVKEMVGESNASD